MAEVSAKPNFPSARASRRWWPGRRLVLSAGLALAMTAAGAAAGTAGTATARTAGPASPPGHLQYPTCPRTSQGNTQGMQTLATSYAVNARSFMVAMKKADAGPPERGARHDEHLRPGGRAGLPVPTARRARGPGLPQHQHQLGQDGDLQSRPPLSGQLRTWTYSTGNQNPANSKIVQGTLSASSAAGGISLPPASLVILQSS
jgi:hypothetical protein